MPRRDQVAALLKAHEDELRARGVQGLFLFGSVGRGEERPGSDVDLFFDHQPGLRLEVIAIQEFLRQIVPGELDITTRRSLHPLLRMCHGERSPASVMSCGTLITASTKR